MKQFLLFLLCASLLMACAKIQYNKKYFRESEHTLAADIPYTSIIFLDNQRVVIQKEIARDYISSSTGYWRKKGNKISVKSDLQEDSASFSPYHKVEKYLNPTRSLDTVYIHAMDSLGKPIMYPRISFDGRTDEQKEFFWDFFWNMLDTNYLELAVPDHEVLFKMPKQTFLSLSTIYAGKELHLQLGNDAVPFLYYDIQPVDSQYNEFYFEMKTMHEYFSYAYFDEVYYLYPSGNLCSSKYKEYLSFRTFHFLRKHVQPVFFNMPKKYRRRYEIFFSVCLRM